MNPKRRQKLSLVVDAIRELNEFSTDDAKLVCRECAPGYVTRTINRLVRHGFLDKQPHEKKKIILRWIDEKREAIEQWLNRETLGEQIKATPEPDRPREVLIREGAASLTIEQLIAILIRVGVSGESSLQAGRLIANQFADRLYQLPEISMTELKSVSRAIRKDSFSQIMAGIELGRRVIMAKEKFMQTQVRIKNSDDAIAFCKQAFARLAIDAKQEQFHIVTLDTQLGVLNTHLISIGTLDASLVHPREVFRPAIRDAAAAIVLVHNHPSGDTTPSSADRVATEKLKASGDLLGIRVIDHIIVASDKARSLLTNTVG